MANRLVKLVTWTLGDSIAGEVVGDADGGIQEAEAALELGRVLAVLGVRRAAVLLPVAHDRESTWKSIPALLINQSLTIRLSQMSTLL